MYVHVQYIHSYVMTRPRDLETLFVANQKRCHRPSHLLECRGGKKERKEKRKKKGKKGKNQEVTRAHLTKWRCTCTCTHICMTVDVRSCRHAHCLAGSNCQAEEGVREHRYYCSQTARVTSHRLTAATFRRNYICTWEWQRMGTTETENTDTLKASGMYCTYHTYPSR